MKPTIVIGFGTGALSVISCLGNMGIPIISVYWDPSYGFSIAKHSKYVAERFKLPNPRITPNDLLAFLLRKGKRWAGSLIIPAQDVETQIISKNSERLSDYYVVSTPEWPITKRLLDKNETYHLAKRLDIPTPRSFCPDTLSDLEDYRKSINFPCILKPLAVPEFFAHFRRKNIVVKTFEELKRVYDVIEPKNLKIMISEIIPGNDDQLFELSTYIDKQGNALGTFLARKIRQDPPGFGIGRVVESTELIPILKEQAEKMLNALEFRGIAQVEFKKDLTTGEYKLLEINPRVHNFMNLLCKCGINLPYIMYADLVEDRKLRVSHYNKHVYWIDLYADLKCLLFHHNKENWKFFDYLAPYQQENIFDALSFEDPKPGIIKILSLARLCLVVGISSLWKLLSKII